MGLVEVGVGVIPGAGGCKELIARLKDPRKVFELVGMAKVSTSAENAKELGLLEKGSGHFDERGAADRGCEGARRFDGPVVPAGKPEERYQGDRRQRLCGAQDRGVADEASSGYISRSRCADRRETGARDYRRRTLRASTWSPNSTCSIWNARLSSACAELPKTQERMQFMLKTGKPLRN